MRSESTSALGHPKLTKPTVGLCGADFVTAESLAVKAR